MAQSLFASHIYDGEMHHHDAWLNIEHNRVHSITKSPVFLSQSYYSDGMLIPGFIDLQVNGGGGVLFNNEPTLEGIRTIVNAHRALGTHHMMITLITSDDDTIARALDAVEAAMEEKLPGLLGIHLEGPMINAAKRGIHFEKNIHPLSDELLQSLTQRNLGKVMITLAPEIVPPSMIQSLTDAGIIVFAGHTHATADEAQSALNHGLKGFTHLFNAMPPMLSREPSILGVALSDQNSYGSIIHDGIHVDPIMVKIAIEAKHPDNIVLVTDAMATLGSDLMHFDFNGHTIYREENRLVNHEGKLAGAHIDLYSCIQNTMALNYSFEKSLQMATRNPSTVLGLYPTVGSLKKCANANVNHINGDKITPLL
ncbi:N-acetylglucosamine-6-phosphate deacetylase [Wohlfahrtiimonas chitiniclastica]|uniref:N-acetylglucosamine-6-phosphate deacetylase n=1 Tax=Wohlfahrtiimonas chitiniclastica TaxID=400946 RepID=UPI000363AF20|nr:N-acetylglucosamine-6-phosphate deacetylase [Wohlfahrtiimonas chitiniclastica]